MDTAVATLYGQCCCDQDIRRHQNYFGSLGLNSDHCFAATSTEVQRKDEEHTVSQYVLEAETATSNKVKEGRKGTTNRRQQQQQEEEEEEQQK